MAGFKVRPHLPTFPWPGCTLVKESWQWGPLRCPGRGLRGKTLFLLNGWGFA